MFEALEPDRAGPALSERLRAFTRHPIARVLVAAFVAALVGGAVYATSVYGRMVSDACVELPRADIEMSELIAMKRRVEAYQTNPNPSAEIVLSGFEASFLLRDSLSYAVWIELVGDRANVRLAMPRPGGCYNVSFVGVVEVHDGELLVVPERLVIGEFDATPWVGGDRWHVRRSWLPDEKSVEIVSNIESLFIEHGRASVRLVDRWKLW